MKLLYTLFLNVALLDNYNPLVGNTEDANSKETQESWAFLQAISATGPFKELHKYLAKKGMTSWSMVSISSVLNSTQAVPRRKTDETFLMLCCLASSTLSVDWSVRVNTN